jgi:hypothetical protein
MSSQIKRIPKKKQFFDDEKLESPIPSQTSNKSIIIQNKNSDNNMEKKELPSTSESENDEHDTDNHESYDNNDYGYDYDNNRVQVSVTSDNLPVVSLDTNLNRNSIQKFYEYLKAMTHRQHPVSKENRNALIHTEAHLLIRTSFIASAAGSNSFISMNDALDYLNLDDDKLFYYLFKQYGSENKFADPAVAMGKLTIKFNITEKDWVDTIQKKVYRIYDYNKNPAGFNDKLITSHIDVI